MKLVITGTTTYSVRQLHDVLAAPLPICPMPLTLTLREIDDHYELDVPGESKGSSLLDALGGRVHALGMTYKAVWPRDAPTPAVRMSLDDWDAAPARPASPVCVCCDHPASRHAAAAAEHDGPCGVTDCDCESYCYSDSSGDGKIVGRVGRALDASGVQFHSTGLFINPWMTGARVKSWTNDDGTLSKGHVAQWHWLVMGFTPDMQTSQEFYVSTVYAQRPTAVSILLTLLRNVQGIPTRRTVAFDVRRSDLRDTVSGQLAELFGGERYAALVEEVAR